MNAAVVQSFRTTTRVASVLVGAVGLLGFIGWVFNAEALKAAFTGSVTIKANAALSLMLLGAALFLLAPEQGRPRWRLTVGRAFAAVAMGVGALTLAEHLGGYDFGIDQLLFHEPPGAAFTASPGRMGPPASLSVFLSGLALLLLDVRTRRGGVPAQWLALGVGLIALLPLIGYAYGAQLLYGMARYTGIAFHTAAAIAVLAIGLLAARPTAGLMALVCADDAGGATARRLLLPAVLIPFALGWLRTLGGRLGWFDEGLGRPLLVLALIVSFAGLVMWNAKALSVLGRQRARAEAERLRGEAALRASEQQMRLLTDALPTLIGYVDTEHRYRFNNRAYLEWFGTPQRDLAGKHLRDVLGEAEYRQRLPQVEAALRGETVQFEGPSRHRTRGLVECELLYVPDVGADGRVAGFVVLAQDITQRKRAEAALRESEERLRQMADAMPQVVWAARGDGQVDYHNRQWFEYTGTPEAAGSHDWPRVIHPEDLPGVLQQWHECVRSGRPYEREFRMRHGASGTYRWFLARALPVRDHEGEVRWYGTDTDITEWKRVAGEREQLLANEQAARAEAERASDAKSQFLATLSHELRTPLTPVLLTVSLMESHPALPEDLRDDVATIRRNVELESRLISDLLDLTRIARGKLQLDEQDVDLHLIVRSAIDICQREASAKLTLDLGAALHTVRGDSTRLSQVFWNLVSNAIKFTGLEGTVTVRSTNPDAGRIRVEVIDTGAGIDPEVLPRLFNAFEQGEVRATRQQAGLGLGLSISRKLAEAHGGTVAASSEGRGRGATFTVELPVVSSPAPPATAQPPPRRESGGSTLDVLLVEDHEPTLSALTKLLRSLGHRVTGATSVASATATARHDGFDLIICDIGLPDGSGLDVMRQLSNQYTGRAIALTGYGMESDVAASHEAGFAQHLTKPVDLAALEGAIRRVVDGPLDAVQS